MWPSPRNDHNTDHDTIKTDRGEEKTHVLDKGMAKWFIFFLTERGSVHV